MTTCKKNYQREFCFIVSLGKDCEIATQIKRLNLRKKSGPLDWLIVPEESLIKLFEKDFKNFASLENLEFENPPIVKVKDKEYNIEFLHNFHISSMIGYYHKEFMKTLDRRVERLIFQLKNSKDILLIKKEGTLINTKKINEILKKIRNNKPYHLIAIGHTNEFKTNWNIENVSNFHTPKDKNDNWQGDNNFWDKILKDVTLNKTQVD